MHNNSLCTAANAEAVLSFLRDRGILEDEGATPQQVEEKKRKQAYHNTLLLLTNYQSILWQTESELESVAAELNLPLRKLENRRLELRLERLAKTRQLLDQINDALTSLKHKPGNGQLLYDLIYLTYIAEDKMRQTDVLFRLNVSRRHYYRLKEQAISIISLRLWCAPNSDLDLWLELVSMLSKGEKNTAKSGS